MSSITLSLFQSSLMLYVPLVIVAVFGILFIPSLLVQGAKPEGVAKAIGCYLMQTLGIVLIGLSAVQVTYAIMNGRLPEFHTLSALLFLFCLGLGILVHQSVKAATVDEASLMVPRLVFSHMCEIVGTLIALVAALSLVVTFMISENFYGWQMSATMLLLGVALMILSSIHIEKRNAKAGKAMRKKK